MQNMNNALRLGTFISQLEARRSEQVPPWWSRPRCPTGTSMTTGPGEAQLLELFQDTFAQYTAIVGAATVQPEASVAFRSWRTYLAWACDPTLNVKELLAGEGLQLQS